MIYIYLSMCVLFMYYIYSIPKKEYLEIIQVDNKIYFLLSGDEYLIVPSSKNNKELIIDIIKKYRNELSILVDKIILVNLKYKNLEKELNSIIKA